MDTEENKPTTQDINDNTATNDEPAPADSTPKPASAPAGKNNPKKSKKKLLTIILAVVAVAALAGAAYLMFGKSEEKKPASEVAKTSTTSNSADENGLVSSISLQCVPRGHDYYRTNSTLAVDPANSNTVYVGVEYKGVYKSTDGGTTWQQSDKGIRGYAKESDKTQKCIQELGRTIIDPTDSKHIIISRVESPGDLSTRFSENAGLWETKNGGQSWSQMVKSGMNASGSMAIAFDPADSKTVYYGSNNMTPSFTDENGQKMQRYFNKNGILYKTANSGSTWAELPTGASPNFRAVNVAVDNKDSKKIWFFTFTANESGGTPDESKQKPVLISADGGKTWATKATNLPAGSKTLVTGMLSPKNGNYAYLIPASQGLPQSFYTNDGGTTWLAANIYTFSAAYDTSDPNGLKMLGYAPYAAQPGIVQSTDGGKTWVKIANLPADVDGKDKFGVQVSGFAWSSDGKTVYMSASGSMVWKSTDGGKTWVKVMDLSKIGGPNKNAQGSERSSEQDQ